VVRDSQTQQCCAILPETEVNSSNSTQMQQPQEHKHFKNMKICSLSVQEEGQTEQHLTPTQSHLDHEEKRITAN
jgi:hypothetical protein